MSAAVLNQGLTSIRDALKTLFSPYVFVSDDSTAFSATQTSGNPAGGSTVFLAKSATIANVDGKTYTATISVGGGDATIVGKSIYTVGASLGVTNTQAQSRTVRGAGLGIGVQTGDAYTIGIQVAVADNS